MKKIFTFIILLLFSNGSNLFAQQYYYTFSELKGMEDNNDNSHLFYRLYSYWEDELSFREMNSIYHLDTNSGIDSFFLSDYNQYYNFTGPEFIRVHDLEFWNNNVNKYIYCGEQGTEDGIGFVQRYDMEYPVNLQSFSIENIELSAHDDSLLYAAGHSIFRSVDGGRNWEVFDSTYRNIISINPYSDDIFLGDYDSLYKSTDGGLNFSVVDTSNYYFSQFFYDKDSIHIYSIVNKHLKVSNNDGNAFSWTERYTSSNPIYLTVDYSQSGSIYLADWKYIYHSTDYGVTFTEYKTSDRRIVGIYKKPNSDKLYAATKYDLYEITPDTILTLKHLPLDPDIFSWFPLKVGNKWIYNSRFTSESETNEHTLVIEVTGQFRYDDKTYFDINGEYGLCYRIDSTSGKIYRAYFDNDTLDYEELYIDLTAEIGDTIYVVQFGGSYPILLANEEAFNDWNLNLRKRNYLGQSTPLYDLSLVKNVGLYYQLEWELVGYEDELKGAVIDGKVYGDTTVVGVNDPDNTIKEFSLSQNYPNPFNPSTKIKFAIPKSSFVNLKVYDVLGREVAILVNEEKYPGSYEAEFNGINLSSGIYFSVLNIGDKRLSKKMCLLK